MCEYCPAGTSAPAASSSKFPSASAKSTDQDISSDAEMVQEVERELEVKEGMEGDASGLAYPIGQTRPGAMNGKRGLVEETTNPGQKRVRTEDVEAPSIGEANLCFAVSNLTVLVGNLERMTEEAVSSASLSFQKYHAQLNALQDENAKLRLSAKKAEELECVLWKVRDDYFKLKTLAATQADALKKADSGQDGEETADNISPETPLPTDSQLEKPSQVVDQQIEHLRQSLQTLTKDYDELKKENEGLRAQNDSIRVQREKHRSSAEEHAKKANELMRVLWRVRDDYYKQKEAAKQADAKAVSLSTRVDELSRELSQARDAKSSAESELGSAKSEADRLKKRNSSLQRSLDLLRDEHEQLKKKHVALQKSHDALRDEHDQLKHAWTLSIVGAQR